MISEVLPHILSLTEAILTSCRASLLYQTFESTEEEGKYNTRDYVILDNIMSIASAGWGIESLLSFLPTSLKSALDKWRSIVFSPVPWVS